MLEEASASSDPRVHELALQIIRRRALQNLIERLSKRRGASRVVNRDRPQTANTGASSSRPAAGRHLRQDATLDIRAVWTDDALKRIIDELIVPALVDEYLGIRKPLPETRTHEP
jgi:hypothetical protein